MPVNYSTNIVYLSKAQYQELLTNQTITVNGTTVTYNENDIYVTPQAEPITDVKLAGTSIGSNGVANIPLATDARPGIGKISGSYGTAITNDGYFRITKAYDSDIKDGSNAYQYRPLTPDVQHKSVFYGLSKVAGVDLKNETVTLGTYPDSSKAAIQNMLGITDLISTEESSTATAAHVLNSTFMMDGKLHRATVAIAIGDAVEVGTNCEVVKADEVFVKKTDYAAGTVGVVTINEAYGIKRWSNTNPMILINQATSNFIKSPESYATSIYRPITPDRQHEAVYYGLSKLAGVNLANEEVTLGIYPETSKTAIRSLIGAAAASDIPSVPVQDVQVNATSIVSNGVAAIPLADVDTYGTVKLAYNGFAGLQIANGYLAIAAAGPQRIKEAAMAYMPITPVNQHYSVFYGLATAAGDTTMASSSNAVGTYTDSAKTAIRSMIGAENGDDLIKVQDTQPSTTATKLWMLETAPAGVQIPTVAEVAETYVAKTDIATSSIAGIVKVNSSYGIGLNGLDQLQISGATSSSCKAGTSGTAPVVPIVQHAAAFYGLAKAAGDTTQALSANAVGIYTEDAKTAIKNMLGIASGIPDPATKAAGDFLVYNGTEWVAQTLATWQGGNY